MTAIEGFQGVFAAARDITDRKGAEERTANVLRELDEEKAAQDEVSRGREPAHHRGGAASRASS